MPTLTRSVGLSAKELGTVLPLNRFYSNAVFSTRSGNKLFSQKLRLRASPIGGLEIGWLDLGELEENDSREIVSKTLALHTSKGNSPYYNFRVNEPELWIPRVMCPDIEIWASLMLEVFISGIGVHRKELQWQMDSVCISTTGKKLVDAYRLHNFRIDTLYAEMIRKDKDLLFYTAQRLMKEPHGLLGVTWGHACSLTKKELKKFQACRPFWATDFDKLEEILQIPSDDIFGFCRGIGNTWISTENACCRAAENLGYTIPEYFEDVPAQQPAIVEVKPQVSSNVKDRKFEAMTSIS